LERLSNLPIEIGVFTPVYFVVAVAAVTCGLCIVLEVSVVEQAIKLKEHAIVMINIFFMFTL
ncbi:hypothetical protein ABTL89_10990, partial [Acinetobacter baumannii]